MPTPPAPAPLIRDATVADAAALVAIYNHFVQHTAVTFEEVPVSVEEFTRRMDTVRGVALPYLGAEVDGVIAGYAYAIRTVDRRRLLAARPLTLLQGRMRGPRSDPPSESITAASPVRQLPASFRSHETSRSSMTSLITFVLQRQQVPSTRAPHYSKMIGIVTPSLAALAAKALRSLATRVPNLCFRVSSCLRSIPYTSVC